MKDRSGQFLILYFKEIPRLRSLNAMVSLTFRLFESGKYDAM
jgi:hypothetical protein